MVTSYKTVTTRILTLIYSRYQISSSGISQGYFYGFSTFFSLAPTTLLTTGNHWSSLHFYSFVISCLLYEWNHTVYVASSDTTTTGVGGWTLLLPEVHIPQSASIDTPEGSSLLEWEFWFPPRRSLTDPSLLLVVGVPLTTPHLGVVLTPRWEWRSQVGVVTCLALGGDKNLDFPPQRVEEQVLYYLGRRYLGLYWHVRVGGRSAFPLGRDEGSGSLLIFLTPPWGACWGFTVYWGWKSRLLNGPLLVGVESDFCVVWLEQSSCLKVFCLSLEAAPAFILCGCWCFGGCWLFDL